jgi:chitinase
MNLRPFSFSICASHILGLIGAWGFSGTSVLAQPSEPALVGYWHNWNDFNAPYLPLDAVDDRYDWIAVAFALPASPTDMTLVFNPEGTTPEAFSDQIASLQSAGKKVLLSIGGATASVDLASQDAKNDFIQSANALIDAYGFDGLDVDIEHGSAILVTGGTVAAPSNPSQVNLIDAVKQIMANHRATHGEKMLLTLAPETAYVQGGQAAFGSIWGGYLPILDALRDSLDGIQVQLYNSGSMPGLDQVPYEQGTADFIVAMTEAVIQGFPTAGGYFAGLPAHKVRVGLPACPSAAGGGFVDATTCTAAIQYLKGEAAQPGNYTLSDPSGYPDLGGMMTWSINWDAASGCGELYGFADVYADLFPEILSVPDPITEATARLFPNPSTGRFVLSLPEDESIVTVFNGLGQTMQHLSCRGLSTEIHLPDPGNYWIQIASSSGTVTLPARVQH